MQVFIVICPGLRRLDKDSKTTSFFATLREASSSKLFVCYSMFPFSRVRVKQSKLHSLYSYWLLTKAESAWVIIFERKALNLLCLLWHLTPTMHPLLFLLRSCTHSHFSICFFYCEVSQHFYCICHIINQFPAQTHFQEPLWKDCRILGTLIEFPGQEQASCSAIIPGL